MEKKVFESMNFEGGFIQKPGTGSRSYTAYETKTVARLEAYKITSQLKGIKLELKNKDNLKYYLVEDGTLFKYDTNELTFYRLNLDDFTWDYDPSLKTIFYDAYLKYQQLLYFEDFYVNREDLDLSNGRQL